MYDNDNSEWCHKHKRWFYMNDGCEHCEYDKKYLQITQQAQQTNIIECEKIVGFKYQLYYPSQEDILYAHALGVKL